MLWSFVKKANFQSVILICDIALSSKYVYSLEDYKHNLISIIFTKELTVFEKRVYYFFNLIFNMHFLPITLENQWFIWYHNCECFSICSNVCWELSLYLNVSHRVFQFFALFCHIKNAYWEQFLVICWSNVWRRNNLFNIVKFCSKSGGITVNSWEFLLCEIVSIVINLRERWASQTCWWDLQWSKIDGLCSWSPDLSVWNAMII